ncbi:MAG: Cytosol non-specific dipeptidase [Phycisphaerae bacterium]|nr:Cytosol non-specific dipeptidase [Phycisphaerae bacterium]
MATTIESLEPKAVWRFFAGLAGVPRPSKKEERIRKHVREVAAGLGLTAREDAVGNLAIDVPATPGYEKAPTIILQGHLDMVCEKNSTTTHNFDTDPIKLVVDQDAKGQPILRAAGTTLGADNGVGVALAMAAATEKDGVHGPLELFLTIDEEQGMTGAKALQAGFLKGKMMINLDSEEDDMLYIGCAGGCDVNLTWKFAVSAPSGGETCKVTVSGLRGGHSGCDIHFNRASANKLLAHTLLDCNLPVQISEIVGGNLRNAIPREARALVSGPAGLLNALTAAAQRVQAVAHRDHLDTSAVIKIERASAAPAASATDSRRLLQALVSIPHGVLGVVHDIPGLIKTSNSMSTIKSETTAGQLQIDVGCLARSSSMDQLDQAVSSIIAVGQLSGADHTTGNQYPGWQPNADSPLLTTCRRLYEQLFGHKPLVTAIHAGLECGIIGERLGGGVDMISFGPTITGAHSPDEKVYINSVQKIWKYLRTALAELAKG